jgi:hypothetical protein
MSTDEVFGTHRYASRDRGNRSTTAPPVIARIQSHLNAVWAGVRQVAVSTRRAQQGGQAQRLGLRPHRRDVPVRQLVLTASYGWRSQQPAAIGQNWPDHGPRRIL